MRGPQRRGPAGPAGAGLTFNPRPFGEMKNGNQHKPAPARGGKRRGNLCDAVQALPSGG
jgi:hypothetical protein